MQHELVTSNMEYAYDTQRPMFRWDDQEVLLERKKVADSASLSLGDMIFRIQLRLAYNIGFLAKDMTGKCPWVLISSTRFTKKTPKNV